MANAGKEFFQTRYRELGGDLKTVEIFPTIRINTLLTTAKELIPRLEALGVKLERIPFTKNGYRVLSTPFSLGAITEYLLGYYYLQEAAAQLPVEVLDAKSTDNVLDMCAAPGGKTTQLAAAMDNKGSITSYELKPHRVTSLLVNLERCNVKNTTVIQGDVRKETKQFSKILLDAPCSGNYLLEEDWLEKRTLDDIQKSSDIQKRLLQKAIDLMAPNGTLVYSTCSLEPEENELVINWALENFPVKLQKVSLSVGSPGLTNAFGKELHPDLALCKRFWPYKTNTEGFFIAKLVKP